MTQKPVVPRERAEREIDEAIDYYSSEDAPDTALGFIDALDQAYRHIGSHPDTGSSRRTHYRIGAFKLGGGNRTLPSFPTLVLLDEYIAKIGDGGLPGARGFLIPATICSADMTCLVVVES